MNTVNLYQLNGNSFRKISYININNLKEILNNILEEYNTDSFIQLILNNTIINIGNEDNNFNFYIINNLESELKNDDFIQVIFVCKKSLFIEYINNDLSLLNKKYKNDKYYKIIKYLIGTNKYKFIIDSTYRDLIIDSVKYYGYTLEHVNNYFKNDKEIVICAIRRCGLALQYASDIMKNDKEVVLIAINNNSCVLKYVSNHLKNDKDVVLAAVKQSGYVLQYASDYLKNDKDVVLCAVKVYGIVLKYASSNLQNDKDIVLEAVKQNGNSLLYASINMKSDIDVVLIAIKNTIYAYEYIDKSLIDNKHIRNYFYTNKDFLE